MHWNGTFPHFTQTYSRRHIDMLYADVWNVHQHHRSVTCEALCWNNWWTASIKQIGVSRISRLSLFTGFHLFAHAVRLYQLMALSTSVFSFENSKQKMTRYMYGFGARTLYAHRVHRAVCILSMEMVGFICLFCVEGWICCSKPDKRAKERRGDKK